MADSSERGAGKPTTTGAHKTKGRRVQGGRVIESRYLQYEKKTKKVMESSTSGATVSASTGGKPPEERKASALSRSKDSQVIGMGDLQSTMLEGHVTTPPNLDLSGINDKSMFRKPPQLDRTMSKEAQSVFCTTPQKKKTLHKKRRLALQDLQKTMDMMESQTLLLTLLSVKMENNLTLLEEKAEKDLAAMCREKEKLQGQVLELRRQLLLQQKHEELAAALDAQMELLGPFQAVAERFKEQYKTLATALDNTRHELPVQAIHMQGSGQELLDDLQPALRTTLQLLGELGICSPDSSVQEPCLLEELRNLTKKKDLELHRIVDQVLELSSQASKEVALINQEVWEEAPGTPYLQP
ncbi:HAUS augmin-like complex subunit 8 isoform X2 [Cricetulus griseus]|uniref:HAUS augmin-like complex subunit 8 isoform X10 n=1 Tax=Cricetulus griseus TaxID=10029 RepID=A0A9J7H924_CRIGR|nr:HAUS augmin-like complex subunit 8 isoform X2 [Cricetulus griseus]XP_035307491.1 HAUS augmin-like complex subunit 8 isoform X10 [Cricetulus griseus]